MLDTELIDILPDEMSDETAHHLVNLGQCRFEWVKNNLILAKTLLVFLAASILHRDIRKLCAV